MALVPHAVVKLVARGDELTRVRDGAVLIGFLTPWAAPEMHAALDARAVRAFAMESIPRISRAGVDAAVDHRGSPQASPSPLVMPRRTASRSVLWRADRFLASEDLLHTPVHALRALWGTGEREHRVAHSS